MEITRSRRDFHNANHAVLSHPLARIAPQLHPRAELALVQVRPAHLNVAKHALGVRHHGGEAAVCGGDRGQATGAAVRVERIGLGRGTGVA